MMGTIIHLFNCLNLPEIVYIGLLQAAIYIMGLALRSLRQLLP